ncbi:GNAT family N-acetyltransferase [Alkalicoccobacillus gibsonii]|uniref:GNAT family N-acetyltransferase n=1 Tax=Alkalicoccobacillus gibsonii TaxID=79881 RepID=UPI0035151EA9
MKRSKEVEGEWGKEETDIIYLQEEPLIIRSMREDDIEKFVVAFKEQGWQKPCELFEEYYKQQTHNERKVIVAALNNQICGYVTLLDKTITGPFATKSIPEIVDLNVLIKYQKKGIGNKMMDVAETLAKQKSDLVSLAVGLHYGYGSAQRMYIKRGYVPDGSGAWYRGKQLEQYSSCMNDDDLTLYLSKNL